MDEGEKTFLKDFLSHRALVGVNPTYTEVYDVMKKRFGRRTSVIEVMQVRKELGQTIFFDFNAGKC